MVENVLQQLNKVKVNRRATRNSLPQNTIQTLEISHTVKAPTPKMLPHTYDSRRHLDGSRILANQLHKGSRRM
eukprot:6186106-Pleurochrysis_carterae.AAC.2